MKIETKYDTGQEIFIKEDGEWLKGEISGIFYSGTELYYEIHLPEIYRYYRQTEAEIITDQPEEFGKTNEFLNLFPEFDQYEKNELTMVIRRLRKDAAKRIERTNKKTESSL